jgi:predicted nucleic acid-binding protein
MEFSRRYPTSRLGLPWVVLGEFWHGAIRAGHEPAQVREFLEIGIPLLEPSRVIPVDAEVCSRLQEAAVFRSIGEHDLWIAAASIAEGCPLVTRSSRHFGSIEGLKLLIAGQENHR